MRKPSVLAPTCVLSRVTAPAPALSAGDRDVVSWGSMLPDAQSYLALAWCASVFPGLALGLFVVAVNLAGDGMADAWNVRSTVRA